MLDSVPSAITHLSAIFPFLFNPAVLNHPSVYSRFYCGTWCISMLFFHISHYISEAIYTKIPAWSLWIYVWMDGYTEKMIQSLMVWYYLIFPRDRTKNTLSFNDDELKEINPKWISYMIDWDEAAMFYHIPPIKPWSWVQEYWSQLLQRLQEQSWGRQESQGIRQEGWNYLVYILKEPSPSHFKKGSFRLDNPHEERLKSLSIASGNDYTSQICGAGILICVIIIAIT